MRRFLTAFVCLSILALAQNVIAAAPSSASAEFGVAGSSVLATSTAVGTDEGLVLSPAAPDRNLPAPGTMMLLVAGLSGLAAVGARANDREA